MDNLDNLSSQLPDLELKRRIIDWRDRNLLNIEEQLERDLPVLFSAIKQEYKELSYQELAKGASGFTKKTIDPLVKEWITRESEQLLSKARMELEAIYKKSQELQLEHEGVRCPAPEMPYTDAAVGLGSIAAGVAAIDIATTLATTSFMAITISISWPVVLAGAGVAAALGSVGIFKLGTLKKRAVQRHFQTVEAFVRDLVLGDDKLKEPTSLRHQLQQQIWQVYRSASLEPAS